MMEHPVPVFHAPSIPIDGSSKRENHTHVALDIRPYIEQPQKQHSVLSAFPIPRLREGFVAVRTACASPLQPHSGGPRRQRPWLLLRNVG